MKKGIVKEFDATQGFCFIISQDNKDYFVHVSGLREHLKSKGLGVGQSVSFDVDLGIKGDKAINVRVY